MKIEETLIVWKYQLKYLYRKVSIYIKNTDKSLQGKNEQESSKHKKATNKNALLINYFTYDFLSS